MNRPPREVWLFRVELPAGIDHAGRFMAKLLKHLLRVWGVKATAILDAPTEPAREAPGLAQDATKADKTTSGQAV